MDHDDLLLQPDASPEPVGRLNLRPDTPDAGAEAPFLSARQCWKPVAIPLGLLAIVIMVAALIFILQGAYEPVRY